MRLVGANLVGGLFLLASASLAQAEPPAVVVSIKPLHGLAVALMEGVGEPSLLLDGTASPHGYSLRPSEARELSEADLIVWVGPTLESFLAQPMDSLAESATVVTALELPGMVLLEAREGGLWEAHDHDHDEEHHHGEEHHGEEQHAEEHHEDHDLHAHDEADAPVDPHIWLDPRNAALLADAIAAALVQADPGNSAHYQDNLRTLKASLQDLDRGLAERLAGVSQQPYIVFHDGYIYFEERYGLSPVGSISVTPDQRPGARRISEIRDLVLARGARCIFAEPQFAPALIETIAEGSEIASGTLDPLGATIAKGPDAYQETLRALAQGLIDCLTVSG